MNFDLPLVRGQWVEVRMNDGSLSEGEVMSNHERWTNPREWVGVSLYNNQVVIAAVIFNSDGTRYLREHP